MPEEIKQINNKGKDKEKTEEERLIVIETLKALKGAERKLQSLLK